MFRTVLVVSALSLIACNTPSRVKAPSRSRYSRHTSSAQYNYAAIPFVSKSEYERSEEKFIKRYPKGADGTLESTYAKALKDCKMYAWGYHSPETIAKEGHAGNYFTARKIADDAHRKLTGRGEPRNNESIARDTTNAYSSGRHFTSELARGAKEGMTDASEAYAKIDAVNNTTDIVNYIELSPSTISRNWYKAINVEVNLTGSPARAGIVFIEQLDGFNVATIQTTRIQYDPGENLVYGKIFATVLRPGSITIRAKVLNNRAAHSTAEATLNVR